MNNDIKFLTKQTSTDNTLIYEMSKGQIQNRVHDKTFFGLYNTVNKTLQILCILIFVFFNKRTSSHCPYGGHRISINC